MLKNCTLVFLVEFSGSSIARICLAMKKRGFGINRWNGVGGKVQAGETLDEAVRREVNEEISVHIKAAKKVGELSFYFLSKPKDNQLVHVYICNEWAGTPVESEEVNPFWFNIENIPYDRMWPDDKLWLPRIIRGEKVRAYFVFNSENEIHSYEFLPSERVNDKY